MIALIRDAWAMALKDDNPAALPLVAACTLAVVGGSVTILVLFGVMLAMVVG